MVSKVLTVVNPEGLHMRPAGMLVEAAMAYDDCEIIIKSNDKQINAKSIMQVLTAGIDCGAEIELSVSGNDEKPVLDKLAKMIENGFKQ